ncbi:MAG: hypothetical protein NC300_03340 [Bacteroidales bacterium]|nr:hypothetical protein [Clostridium sp.]MCM1203153.1 hypothetical protein [Bacteroidales bacterium]
MDENYLDSLLNEISLDKEIDHNLEDDLDNQMQRDKERRQQENTLSQEDVFNLNLEQEVNGLSDDRDMHFSEAQMEELDRLDNLADLDIGDLDFSDIDFDNLEITNLDDIGDSDIGDVLKDFESDLQIGDFQEENVPNPEAESGEAFNTDSFLNGLLSEEDNSGMAAEDSAVDLNAGAMQEAEQSFDIPAPAEDFSGLEEAPQPAPAAPQEDSLSSADEEDLDSLLSMLDMEGSSESDVEEMEMSAEPGASILDGAEEIKEQDDIAPAKKRGFMQILFGDPDEEDELTEEELKAIEEKKAAKAAKKQEKKEQKQEKKEQKDGEKKKANEEKQKVRAEKKEKKKQEALANAEPEKKLNKPAVAFIFSVFLGGTFLFYLLLNQFNYAQAVGRAEDYFGNQKYRSAYDEIVGVEIKEPEEELRDRIYTVMYVERLYEAYENNIQLGFQEKALDSLLRGVSKYYEYQKEAQELGVGADIEYSFDRIRSILQNNYGISIEQALAINALEDAEYARQISGYAATVSGTEEENDNTGNNPQAEEQIQDGETVSE